MSGIRTSEEAKKGFINAACEEIDAVKRLVEAIDEIKKEEKHKNSAILQEFRNTCKSYIEFAEMAITKIIDNA